MYNQDGNYRKQAKKERKKEKDNMENQLGLCTILKLQTCQCWSNI